MAVVSRIAKLDLNDGLGNGRLWTATAAVQDTAAGGSVVVTLQRTDSGVPFSFPEFIDVNFYNGEGTLIRSQAMSVVSADNPQTVTFHFTDTGSSGGAARCGTVEIAIRVRRTSIPTYDVETDGSPNTPPAGYTATLDRGWIRGTTTLVEAVSNVSAGGAKNQPAQYDESLFVRTTTGHTSYVARALTVASSVGGLSGSTNSTTSGTRDVTFSNVVDDRFAAAVTTVGWTVTVPNPTLGTGSADWAYTSTTDDTITVDPRLTCQWHFQKDQATFDTSFHDSTFQMLAPQVGQAAVRLNKARTGAGHNGLSVTLTADPTNPGSNSTASSTTSTLDGEAGWSGLVDVCPTGKPGGAWTVSVDVTAPADIDDASYLVGNNQTVTVILPDSRIRLGVGVSPPQNEADHWRPGMDLQVGGGLLHRVNRTLLTPGTPSPTCILSRTSAAGLVEYLNADLTTWTTIAAGASTAAYEHTMVGLDTLTPGADPRVFVLYIPGANTTAWGTSGMVASFLFYDSNGSPFSSEIFVDPTGTANQHSGYAFDGAGFVGFPQR